MSGLYARPVQDLIDQLGRLPGVGPKSAQRIAFHLLKVPREDAARLASAIVEAKERVSFCTRCFNIAEGERCEICLDARRDDAVLCVVEESRDIVALERTARFRGHYHVLQGAISPIEGVGPQQLKVKELVERLRDEPVEEVILATNPNIEGEATALYLSKLLAPIVRVTRLASGLPVGGDLEYADELTLGAALEARRQVEAVGEPADPDGPGPRSGDPGHPGGGGPNAAVDPAAPGGGSAGEVDAEVGGRPPEGPPVG